MKVLFLHGLNSKPGGAKAQALKAAGFDVLNPALPNEPFNISVKIAQDVVNCDRPDVIVGSSRGGAVAMAIDGRISCGMRMIRHDSISRARQLLIHS